MKKFGFLGKQIFAYSLLMMAVVVLLIFLAHSYVIDISQEQAEITQEQMTTSALSQVDSYLDRIMLITTQVAHDSEVVSLMEQLYNGENDPNVNYFEENPQLAELLDQHNEIKDPVYRIAVFTANGDYICTDYDEETLRASVEFVKQDWFQEFLPRAFITEERNFIMMGPRLRFFPNNYTKNNHIYMLMPIKNHEETEIYGYVQVFHTLEPLFAQLDLDKRTDTDIYLFFERNKGDRGGQIYPTDMDYPDTSAGNYHETVVQSHYRWFVVLLQDQDAFLASYHNMLFYLILGGVALFILLFLCVFLLVRHTSKPLLNLSRQVRETSLTNLPELTHTNDTLDEIKELEQSFETMFQRLQTSMQLEQQAYLKALQAQMKPHFLYNCLATVSSMAVELDDTRIPKFCDYLTSILWYESTYENGLVSLSDELKNVRNYLELMKMRYEDDLTYELEAEESLLTLPLPRLVLQPLAENCFDHGFRIVAPPWHVSIRVFREDRFWVIRIADNGVGFDEEKKTILTQSIDKLAENLGQTYSELKIGGLGLANTITRFRLTMDDEVSYAIEDNDPRGTVITLRGPLHD